jgi:sugar phosphate isomerase/epimerase
MIITQATLQDMDGVFAILRANHVSNVPEEEKKNGFVTTNLTEEQMKALIEKENGVTICLENMPMKQLTYSTTAKTLEIIHMIDDENFKLCLDTGHEAIFGNVGDAVRLAGKDLRVFHIHDNSGKRDDHWFPGMGVVDWKDFMAAVKEIEFDGVLSLEVAGNQAFFPSASNDARMKVLTALFGEIVNG